MVIAVLLALVTAFLYTAGLAMQQRGNLDAMRHGDESQSGAGKAVSVLKRPMWLLGNLVAFAGFGTNALALRFGAFLVVVPILAAQLAFMVPAGAWVVRSKVQRREWSPAIAVLAGVALFEIAFNPQAGRATGTLEAWLLTVFVAGLVVLALFAAGRARPDYRAALYGCGAGTWAALLGAFLKELTGGGLWALVAIVVAGPLNVFLLNVAIRAGRLSSAQTTVVAVGTVVSLALGVVVFGESVQMGAWRIVVGIGAAALAGWGCTRLARSPSLLALDHTQD